MHVEIMLKQLLEERNVSQREFAKQTDILYPTINKMCNNTLQHFPLISLAKICETLNCELTDLLVLKRD